MDSMNKVLVRLFHKFQKTRRESKVETADTKERNWRETLIELLRKTIHLLDG